MFSAFPALLDFAIIGVFILRVATGIFFLTFGFRLLQATLSAKEKSLPVRFFGMAYACLKIAVGSLLFVGIFTQVAALLGALLSVVTYVQERKYLSKSAQQVQMLLFALCISLLFLGAGAFAFDMPL